MSSWTLIRFRNDRNEFVTETFYNLALSFACLPPSQIEDHGHHINFHVAPTYIHNYPEDCMETDILVTPDMSKMKTITFLRDPTYKDMNRYSCKINEDTIFELECRVCNVITNGIRLCEDAKYSDISFLDEYIVASYVAWERRCHLQFKRHSYCPIESLTNPVLYFVKEPVHEIILWIEGVPDRGTIFNIINASLPQSLRGLIT